MKWSTKAYELNDGRCVRGNAAAAMRALDAVDTIGPGKIQEHSDGTTREELLAFTDGEMWCEDIGAWVTPSGKDLFSLEPDGRMVSRIEEFLRSRVLWATDQLERHPDEKKRIGKYLAFVKRQDGPGTAARMATSLRNRKCIPASQLDCAPWLIGTPDGAVDLRYGELMAEYEDMYAEAYGGEPTYDARRFKITKRTGASARDIYDDDERWAEFVSEVMDGDTEKIAFLKRALGYSLYGGNPEKATFVLWGPKRDNGKSTLMNAIKAAMGDYAATAPAGLLLEQRNEDYTKANPVLASLPGARLVDVSEPPFGARLDGSAVKKLASGTDEVTCRRMYGSTFSYVPQFKVWMHCNALPIVRDPSAVDPRHMFVIEFTRSFSPDERDITLSERFATEKGKATVLKWLLEGYREYEERGLDAPESVVTATTNWLMSSGTWLDRFIDERCVLGSGEKCLVADFKDAVSAYADSIGAEPMKTRDMNAYLRQMSIHNKCSNGERFYRGISLLETEQVSCSESVLENVLSDDFDQTIEFENEKEQNKEHVRTGKNRTKITLLPAEID